MRRLVLSLPLVVLGLVSLAAGTNRADTVVLDHFLAYKVKPSESTERFVPIPGVSIDDALDPGVFNVTSPAELLVPANKDGEGISDPLTHLRGYKIKPVKGAPKYVARIGITIDNQFGTVKVDAVKPELLLVPSAKDLAIVPPPPNPALHDVDHFKCYRLKLSKTGPAFPKGLTARLSDQFTIPERVFAIGPPRHLCLAANKRREGIKNPLGSLLCYPVKQTKGQCAPTAPVNALGACKGETDCGGQKGMSNFCAIQGKHKKRTDVHIANQFGALTIDTLKERALCVSSLASGGVPTPLPTETPGGTPEPTVSPTASITVSPASTSSPSPRPTSSPQCGDSARNQDSEECDGLDDTSCQGRCRSDCTCATSCGNNLIDDPRELCDGTSLDGKTCGSQGFTAGELRCSADCTALDLNRCTGPVCGDAKVVRGEACDGANLNGETCQSVGFTGGTLTCLASCGGFNSAACLVPTEPPTEPIGNAPPTDRSIPTDLYEETKFLYDSPSPVQWGVVPGTIDPRRVAVLFGRVVDVSGAPLGGVRISVALHPEYGTTLTRANGNFDLVVNGGEKLSVNYDKTNYLVSQRRVDVPWERYAALPDVVLIQEDPVVTPVDFPVSVPMAVAAGSVVTDERGTRQAVVMIPQGTTARINLLDVSRMSLRLTEFTVGPQGPAAMPGDLPPTSAYTYAVEIKPTEALPGQAVQLSQPVSVYVDNFLDFPVGAAVPVAEYSRISTAWLPENDGFVLKIVGKTGSLAELDTNGDGAPDGSSVLTSLGFSDPERVALAARYGTGTSLWRARVEHFTPFDLNPFRECANPPCPDPDNQQPKSPKDCAELQKVSSAIECERQALREDISLVGSDLSLHYSSERVQAAWPIDVALGSVPDGVKSIDVAVQVAGRSSTTTLPPTHSGPYRFTWDGRDRYGRPLQGGQPVRVRVSYTYPALYKTYVRNPGGVPLLSAFGVPTFAGLSPSVLGPAPDIVKSHSIDTFVSAWDPRVQQLGGWSISSHHVYDPTTQTLYLGTGDRRTNVSAGPFFGNSNINVVPAQIGGSGAVFEGASDSPSPTEHGPDGSLYYVEHVYVQDPMNNLDTGDYSARIHRRAPDGTDTVIAGTGDARAPANSGPALSIRLFHVLDLALRPDGSLYFVEVAPSPSYDGDFQSSLCRVRRVLNGFMFLSMGDVCPSSNVPPPDGVRADSVKVTPRRLAIGPDSSVYVTDDRLNVVWRLGRDGRLVRYAGNPSTSAVQYGVPARETALPAELGAIAVAADGSLFVGGVDGVAEVGADGLMRRFFNATDLPPGGGAWFSALSLFPSSNGGLILGEHRECEEGGACQLHVSGLDAHSQRYPIISSGRASAECPDGPLPSSPRPGVVCEYATNDSEATESPDGTLTVSTTGGIFRLAAPLARRRLDGYLFPSSDASELYEFSFQGRHLRTYNAITAAVRWSFGYDSDGRLVRIEDGDGNVTLIKREASGAPTEIVAPDGHRTLLSVDPNGWLSEVRNPAGEVRRFDYSPEGLLVHQTNPRNFESSYVYDDLGRLTSTADAAGGTQTLVRTDSNDAFQIVRTTGLGRQTIYTSDPTPEGAATRNNLESYTSKRDPDGTLTQLWTFRDGSSEEKLPDGGSIQTFTSFDSRYGLVAPVRRSVLRTPGGLTRRQSHERAVTLADDADPMSLVAQIDRATVNGRTSTAAYNPATLTLTRTSPEGRQITRTTDRQGRVVSTMVAGLFPIQFSYDAQGRLERVAQGPPPARREIVFTYERFGFLDAITDPLLRTVGFDYDLAGRVTHQSLPGARQTDFGYDPNGNLLSLVPPGRPGHGFEYSAVDIETVYSPPDVGMPAESTTYEYNGDRQSTVVTRPDGGTIAFDYDGAGRPSTIAAPHGVTAYTYDAAGRVTTVTAPGPESITYTYDGHLLTSTTWEGTVQGSVERAYDDDFRLKTITVNGQNPIAYTYDNDSLVVQVGDMVVTRNPQNGLMTGTTLGHVTDSYEYNGFGEVARYTAWFKDTMLYDLELSNRDPLGRIIEKRETVEGVTHIYEYEYDDAGSLFRVTTDGIQTAEYTYDVSGNRLTAPGLSSPPTYDNQDRLLSYDGVTYSYTANGELETKVDGRGTTTYGYDVFGALRTVKPPEEATVAYAIDPASRRVGRIENGALAQGLLYEDRLRPTAELNENAIVVSRFAYIGSTATPAYMVKAGAQYRIIADHLGSPRLVIDAATGMIYQRQSHDEWGRSLVNTNSDLHPFGFGGGLAVAGSQLIRFGLRDYDPLTGRWTSKDPVRFYGGALGLYLYAHNDPVNLRDSTGLQAEGPCAGTLNDYERVSKELAETRQLLEEARKWESQMISALLANTASRHLRPMFRTHGKKALALFGNDYDRFIGKQGASPELIGNLTGELEGLRTKAIPRLEAQVDDLERQLHRIEDQFGPECACKRSGA